MLLQNFLREIFTPFFDFIYPPICSICSKYLNSGEEVVCAGCISRLERVASFEIEEIFKLKFGERGFIDGIFSCFHFKEDGGVQVLIHKLKYQSKRRIGLILGEMVGQSIFDERIKNCDALIPVPLHKIRFRERGYNQSEIIAKWISKAIGIPVISDILLRKRHTETQTKLSFEQRKENVKDAFSLNEKYVNYVKGRGFIIVDDVITTGSTVNECAKVLKFAGARSVYAVSVAVA